jgi:hypothetical protein
MLITTLLQVALLTSGPAVPLCEYEDGSSQRICVWDARHQGNGVGSSALIINGGSENMRVIRLSHRTAHQLSH